MGPVGGITKREPMKKHIISIIEEVFALACLTAFGAWVFWELAIAAGGK